MDRKETVSRAVFDAVDEINEMLPDGRKLEKIPGAVLIGESGSLDSLGLISFIVAVEGHIQSNFQLSISLADEIANPEGPLQTLETLIRYVVEKVQG